MENPTKKSEDNIADDITSDEQLAQFILDAEAITTTNSQSVADLYIAQMNEGVYYDEIDDNSANVTSSTITNIGNNITPIYRSSYSQHKPYQSSYQSPYQPRTSNYKPYVSNTAQNTLKYYNNTPPNYYTKKANSSDDEPEDPVLETVENIDDRTKALLDCVQDIHKSVIDFTDTNASTLSDIANQHTINKNLIIDRILKIESRQDYIITLITELARTINVINNKLEKKNSD